MSLPRGAVGWPVIVANSDHTHMLWGCFLFGCTEKRCVLFSVKNGREHVFMDSEHLQALQNFISLFSLIPVGIFRVLRYKKRA